MLAIVLECAIFLLLLAVVVILSVKGRDIAQGTHGWLYIRYGFGLLLFGAAVDLTDNTDFLNFTMVLGATPGQVILEKFVGYIGGLSLVAMGLLIWLPAVQRRAHQEKRLRSSIIQSEFAFENCPIGIARGKFGDPELSRNMELARILGYESPEEMKQMTEAHGRSDFLWADPADYQRVMNLVKTEGVVRGVEARFRRKDGSIAWLLLDYVNVSSVVPDFDGDKGYVYCFAKDITLEKKVIRELAESEERFKTILDMMPVGVYLVDLSNDTVVQANPACAGMLCRPHGEVIGRHRREVFGDQADGPSYEESGHPRSHEAEFARRDGTLFPVMRISTRIAMQGRDYLLETFVDISEQKRLEQLKEDVDRIMRHDLRSPVSGVVNAANLALLDDSVQGEAREMFEHIKDQAGRILDMMGMSLALFKIESGTYECASEEVDVAALAQGVVRELRSLFQSRTPDIRVVFNGTPLAEGSSFAVRGDQLLLRSLVANLLTNCLEASPPGLPVTLDVESGDGITMTFANSGVVPVNVRTKFFDKYATSGKSNGTGLGTYTAQLIATQMGGSIDMETFDEENRTVVTVRMPAGLV